MSKTPKGSNPAKDKSAEAAKLLERAIQQPGVADLLKLCQSHAETVRKADGYLHSRTKFVIYSTSDATA